MTEVLQLQAVSRRYGDFVALHPLDLLVQKGERLAVVGANGAGKSTLLKLLGGHLPPSSGRIYLAGQDVTDLPPERRCALGLGLGFQRSSFFAQLSVDDNLLAAHLAQRAQAYSGWRRAHKASSNEADARARHESLLALLGLKAQRHQRAGLLAYGEQRFLEVAMALAQSPSLLVLDEPCAGLNPYETQRMLRALQQLPPDCTLVLVEHDWQVVAALAQRVAVLEQGRLLACDTPRVLASHPEFKAAYLGGHAFGHAQAPAPRPRPVAQTCLETNLNRGLHLSGLSAGYGAEAVIRGIDLHLLPGQAWALLGRNGSGRSTLARVLAGQLPYKGQMLWYGKSWAQTPAYRRARSGLAYVPETRDVFANLSVQDNLGLACPPKRWGLSFGPWTIDAVLDCFPQLAARRQTLAGALSGGEQQMLSLARSLLSNPRLLVVDEPTEGLAPQVVERVHACLLQVKASGCAILLIEQKMDLALAVSDRIAVLGQGQLQWTGTPAQLRQAPAVPEQWLEPAHPGHSE